MAEGPHDLIPVVEVYRGVGIEDEQPRDRIEAVVKPEIDRVLGMTNPRELFDFACDAWHAPESRQLAGAMCESLHLMAAETRAHRPPLDLDKLRAFTAGLGSKSWRSPWRYATLPDYEGVKRERPLTE